MRLLFATVLGLAILGMVSCDWGQRNEIGGHTSFVGSLLSLPKTIVVNVFKAIGAVFRFIFVKIPEGILDFAKRLFFRVAHIFGKKNPYDLPIDPDLGYQSNIKAYNPPVNDNYGSGIYRNPYGNK